MLKRWPLWVLAFALVCAPVVFRVDLAVAPLLDAFSRNAVLTVLWSVLVGSAMIAGYRCAPRIGIAADVGAGLGLLAGVGALVWRLT